MSRLVILLIVTLILLPFGISRDLYPVEHTEVEIAILNKTTNCSPEVLVKVKKFGIEKVISSCVVGRNYSCSFGILNHDLKLQSVCAVEENSTWVLALYYGKQTLFEIPRVELINETLK